NGGIDILAAGCRNDHLLGAALDMRAGLFLAREKARAFQHDIDLELAPGQFGRVAVGQHADLVAVDHHVVTIHRHGARKLAVRRVVLREVGIRLGVAQIVDRNDLDVMLLAAFVVGAQHVTADTAVAIDGNSDGHVFILLWRGGLDSQAAITLLTASVTASAVMPKCLNSAPAGADSPNVSMPTTAPSRPTYLRQ